jgi:hypothetical protein
MDLSPIKRNKFIESFKSLINLFELLSQLFDQIKLILIPKERKQNKLPCLLFQSETFSIFRINNIQLYC